MESQQSLFSNKNIATFILVLMSVHLFWLEGFSTSMIKTTAMAIAPVVLLFRSPKVSSAIVWTVAYLVVTVAIYYFNFSGNELTFVHITLQWGLFCLFYNLVHLEQCFTYEDALRVIKMVVFAYTAFLILQQVFFLMGMRNFHPLNLYGFPYYRLFRLPSLAMEPSHTARILTVYGYAFLKINEYKNGQPLRIGELLGRERMFSICFLYTMLSIGSGTAMVGLALLALYFIKWQYAFSIAVVLILAYIVIPFINYGPLNRAMAVLDAALTLDTSEVYKVDKSASARVGIILLTFQNLDLTSLSTWLGQGVHPGSVSVVEGIEYYGLISYLLRFVLILRCCFTRLISQEMMFYIFLLSLDIRNFYYVFAILMVLSMVKYFYKESSVRGNRWE